MIRYERLELENGLRVILNEDKSTPLTVMNIMYGIGSKYEEPDKTGFAHLFEHLMFGGSANIPKYDTPLQKVGGENNAFTNTDITNYYLSLPSSNLETAFWLESDRMLNLAFSEKSLDVQRHVVIEEFKQNYLNQPYGDVWLELRPLAFNVHSYQWPTIGKTPDHVAAATMDDVRSFFNRYYVPDNAVLCLSGSFDRDEAVKLLEKWFLPISKDKVDHPQLTPEPAQDEARFLELRRPVPQASIYKAFHMCGRTHADYQATDLISDILGNGKSSRLYKKLIVDEQLFTDVRAYITGEHDGGLLVCTGMLRPGVDPMKADEAMQETIAEFSENPFPEEELMKVQNQVEAALVFAEMNPLNRAINLCQSELLGDIEMVNQETDKYFTVNTADIQRIAVDVLKPSAASTMHYLPE